MHYCSAIETKFSKKKLKRVRNIRIRKEEEKDELAFSECITHQKIY